MFERFADNCIKITRGDDASSTLTINAGTKMRPEIYNLKEHPNDWVLFHIMEPNQKFEDALLKRSYNKDSVDDDGNVIISFVRDDTVNLPQGLYYYEVKLVKMIGLKKTYITIIPMSRFIIED